MCGIAGWFGETPQEVKAGILRNGSIRGRDGWGFKAYDRSQPDQEFRSLEKMSEEEILNISKFSRVVGNFRATPTTEALSRIEILQPYEGIVHNGVIANDKTFGDFPIDSMVLPGLLRNQPFEEIPSILQKIEGSYALAWFDGDSLILACNYKPIYFFTDWKSYFAFGSIPEMLPPYSSALKPYSILRINYKTFEFETVELPRTQAPGVVVAASSGLDSTAVAYMLKAKGHEVTLAHFQYGCVAERVEVDRIKKIAAHGGFKLVFLDLPRVFGGSIVEGHYHQEGIRGTEYAMDWVSARNLLMLSVLTAYAETNGIGTIAFGGNLEESGGYPDNEQEFGRLFNKILPYSTQNGVKITLIDPLSTYMKHEIVKLGNECGTPWELTWSCYSHEEKHCGKCGPDFMRKTAFKRNGLLDPVFKHEWAEPFWDGCKECR